MPINMYEIPQTFMN